MNPKDIEDKIDRAAEVAKKFASKLSHTSADARAAVDSGVDHVHSQVAEGAKKSDLRVSETVGRAAHRVQETAHRLAHRAEEFADKLSGHAKRAMGKSDTPGATPTPQGQPVQAPATAGDPTKQAEPPSEHSANG